MTNVQCECGGCEWEDVEDNDDYNEYVVVRFGRCWMPWESEAEHAAGRKFAHHRRNMLMKQNPGVEFHIYQLVRIT